MTVFWTVLAGTLTFVLGQLVLKLLVEPVHRCKSVIAEIASSLILGANVYANPKPHGDPRQEALALELRRLSSELQSSMHLVPWYRCTRYIFGLPNRENIVAASKQLIFLNNGYDSVLANQGILNVYAAQKARIALGIYIPEDELLNPEIEKQFIKAKGN